MVAMTVLLNVSNALAGYASFLRLTIVDIALQLFLCTVRNDFLDDRAIAPRILISSATAARRRVVFH